MPLKFSPSERLLLCCSRSKFDDETRQQILNLLKEKIDWEGFITQARHHGIAASTYLHFKQLEKGIPEEVKNRLRKMYLWNLGHNLKLWSALEQILKTFNQANIEAIPLKGIFLAEHLHGHIGIRSSSDLDLLVRREDFPRAKKELAKIGYVPTRRHTQRSLSAPSYVIKDFQNLTFRIMGLIWKFTGTSTSNVLKNLICRQYGRMRLP